MSNTPWRGPKPGAMAAAFAEAFDIELNCPGSGQPPEVKNGKPHCPVCGRRFRWQDIQDRLRQVPEHG